MASLESLPAPGGVAGEGDRLLRDKVTGICQDLFPERLDLLLGSPGAHQHTVSSRLIGGFDHQFVQIFQNERPMDVLFPKSNKCKLDGTPVQGTAVSGNFSYITVNVPPGQHILSGNQ